MTTFTPLEQQAHDTAVNAANMDALRIAPIKADVEGATPKEARHWSLCEEINDKNTWRLCAEMWRDTALFYRKLLVDAGIIKPKEMK